MYQNILVNRGWVHVIYRLKVCSFILWIGRGSRTTKVELDGKLKLFQIVDGPLHVFTWKCVVIGGGSWDFSEFFKVSAPNLPYRIFDSYQYHFMLCMYVAIFLWLEWKTSRVHSYIHQVFDFLIAGPMSPYYASAHKVDLDYFSIKRFHPL